jgi:hypothetical protein
MKSLSTFLKEINYSDPRNLKDVELDRLIKKSILNINKSDWIWTLFCCQGHKYSVDNYSLPYIVFVVDSNFKGKFFEHLHSSYNINNNTEFPLLGPELEIHFGYSNCDYFIVTIYFEKQSKDFKRARTIINNFCNNV